MPLNAKINEEGILVDATSGEPFKIGDEEITAADFGYVDSKTVQDRLDHVAEKTRGEEKKKRDSLINDRIKELQTDLDKSLSVDEKESLQTKINGLEKQVMSAEEKAAKDRKNAIKEYQEKAKSWEQIATNYRSSLSSERIENTIFRELSGKKLASPKMSDMPRQVLKSNAIFVNPVDPETGEKVKGDPKLMFSTTYIGEDGKSITEDLDISSAIDKNLADAPEFLQATNSGGSGNPNSNVYAKGGKSTITYEQVRSMTPDQFKEVKGKIQSGELTYAETA